ncbi:MAG: DNA alkylation repair protein [Prevotella sp.]|nr:DNA alkylation repair protein [Prevotella sp.]
MSASDQAKEIKRALRSFMDVVTAQSLRQKGCRCKVVWGASTQHLHSLAARYKPDAELAEILWQSDVRECKILATMLMPVNEIDAETANRWLKETVEVEIAEQLVFNLLQHLPFAIDLASKWLDSEEFIPKLAALNLFGRLFMRKIDSVGSCNKPDGEPCNKPNGEPCNEPDVEPYNEPDAEPDAARARKFLAIVVNCLSDKSPAIRRAAMNALIRFAETSEQNRAAALAATHSAGFDFLNS